MTVIAQVPIGRHADGTPCTDCTSCGGRGGNGYKPCPDCYGVGCGCGQAEFLANEAAEVAAADEAYAGRMGGGR